MEQPMSRTLDFELDGGTLTISSDHLTATIPADEIANGLSAETRAGYLAYFIDADTIRAYTTRLTLGDCFYSGSCDDDAAVQDAREKFTREVSEQHAEDVALLRRQLAAATEAAAVSDAAIRQWIVGEYGDLPAVQQNWSAYCALREKIRAERGGK